MEPSGEELRKKHELEERIRREQSRNSDDECEGDQSMQPLMIGAKASSMENTVPLPAQEVLEPQGQEFDRTTGQRIAPKPKKLGALGQSKTHNDFDGFDMTHPIEKQQAFAAARPTSGAVLQGNGNAGGSDMAFDRSPLPPAPAFDRTTGKPLQQAQPDEQNDDDDVVMRGQASLYEGHAAAQVVPSELPAGSVSQLPTEQSQSQQANRGANTLPAGQVVRRSSLTGGGPQLRRNSAGTIDSMRSQQVGQETAAARAGAPRATAHA